MEKEKQKQQRRTSENDISLYGKVPPQAKDLEMAILGAIMMESNAYDVAAELLKPECFYVEAHQHVFRAMGVLNSRSVKIDVLTVVEELRRNEKLIVAGDAYGVTILTNSVVSAAHLEDHSRIVLQKFIQREMIRICGETLGESYADTYDVFELMDIHEKKFTAISIGHMQKSFSSLDKELIKSFAEIQELKNKNQHVTGVHTGFPELDKITHGWQPGDLIILAARPGVGKTALALNFARNAAKHPDRPVAVGFFSLEMSTGQLVKRLLSAESDIDIGKLMNGSLHEGEMQSLYENGLGKLHTAKIFIDDTGALDIFSLRSKARNLKRKEDIGLLVIDYLQLMSGGSRSGNREQEISQISRELKGLGKELGIPIIALSQLSRETEKRKGEAKIPQLSDLRESGAIEQDADTVMFIYRPEYYDVAQTEMGETTRGETHIKIAKHRNGILDTIKLRANLSIQKFFSWDGELPNELPRTGKWRPVQLPFSDKDDLSFDNTDEQ